MLRPILFLGFVVLSDLALTATVAADEPPAKGPLFEHREALQTVLKLRLHEGKLAFDHDHWQRQYDELVKQSLVPDSSRQIPVAGILFDKLGGRLARRFAGTSRSRDRFTSSFGGGGIEGTALVMGDNVELAFREPKAPYQSVRVFDDGESGLRIQLADGRNNVLFALSQQKDGRVTIIHAEDDWTFSATERSYSDFYQKHSEYAETKFLDLLSRFAVKSHLSATDEQIVKAVVGRLRPIEDEQRKQYDRLLARMDDDDFAVRQQAEKELSARAEQFAGLLDESMADQKLGLEVRARITSLVRRRQAVQGEVDSVIDTLGLTRRPAYLVQLLAMTDGVDREVVVGTLQRLTRQNLGDDPVAWRKWLESN